MSDKDQGFASMDKDKVKKIETKIKNLFFVDSFLIFFVYRYLYNIFYVLICTLCQS